jgi:hypothetical protein
MSEIIKFQFDLCLNLESEKEANSFFDNEIIKSDNLTYKIKKKYSFY